MAVLLNTFIEKKTEEGRTNEFVVRPVDHRLHGLLVMASLVIHIQRIPLILDIFVLGFFLFFYLFNFFLTEYFPHQCPWPVFDIIGNH